MIVTLFNFLWIFISAFLVGTFLISILSVQTAEDLGRRDLDLILMLGIMGLAVYAEFFSLLYRLGLLATLVLLGGEILIAVCFRKRIGNILSAICRIRINKSMLLLVCIGIIFFAFAAAQTPDFYDSSLYHGQAIQWIEKYGVVKGLGNLHNRFAYNSAFLCLQALFSWRSVAGQSLHGVNAFLGLVMSVYALSSLSFMKHERIRMADFINLLILFYISVSLDTIASPNTDFLAMLIDFKVDA